MDEVEARNFTHNLSPPRVNLVAPSIYLLFVRLDPPIPKVNRVEARNVTPQGCRNPEARSHPQNEQVDARSFIVQPKEQFELNMCMRSFELTGLLL